MGHADLKIVPLVEEDDTVLAAPDRGSNTLKPTTLWHRVEALIAAWRPALTVFDPLADLFGGDENSRPQARQFIGMLRGLARRQNTTVVLLAHPSLAGMASRSGSSGSTAWNNSVRSRLYLTRITREDGPKSNIEPDADRRLLTAVKSIVASSLIPAFRPCRRVRERRFRRTGRRCLYRREKLVFGSIELKSDQIPCERRPARRRFAF